MSYSSVLFLMTGLFLGLGYMGVPVAFSLMAGVLVAAALTPISLASMIGQMFHGIEFPRRCWQCRSSCSSAS